MSKNIVKKIFAAALSVVMLAVTAVTVPIGTLVHAEDTVSIADKYGDFDYVVRNNEITLIRYTGSDSDIVIPSKIYGKPVTTLDHTFCDSRMALTSAKGTLIYGGIENDNIKSVVIPKSVKVLTGGTFSGCKNLTKVTLYEGLEEIGGDSFKKCESLADISVPKSVKKLGSYAFSYTGIKSMNINDGVDCDTSLFLGCEKLETVKLPNDLKSIKQGFFWGCSSLKEVNIPDTVKEIQNYAFRACYSIKYMDLPEGVEYGQAVFYGCVDLEKVKIPKSMEKIPDAFFLSCYNLKEIEIPENVREIGKSAFVNCRSLKTLSIPETVTKIGEDAFSLCTGLNYIEVKNKNVEIGDYAFGYDGYISWTSVFNRTPLSDFVFLGYPNSTLSEYVEYNNKNNGSNFEIYELKGSTNVLVNHSGVSKTSVPQNTSVIVSGAASGGKGDYKYAFYYKKSTSPAWQSIGEIYGSTTSVSFVPATVADYLVRVNVKDSSGKVVTKQFTIKSTKPTGNDLVNNSTISASNVERNTKITIKGSAKGGSGNYQYAFYYKKASSAAFTAIGTEYGTAATAVFTPASSGTYSVRINVRDSSGTVVTKQYTVVSTAILTNNSTISSTSVKKGTAVKLTAKASGGTAPYTYAFYYKKSTSSAWTKIGTEFGTASFTPAAVAAYNVKIVIKDKTGKTAEKTFTVNSN